jgi:uncharacterized protein
MAKSFLPLLLLPLLLLPAACRDRSKPPSFIDDRAGLLTSAERGRIENYHRRLLKDLDIHLDVVILTGRSADIDAEAVRLFEAYKVGAETRGARGVLLLIDPEGRQVRLEVGYDLEPVFTDLFIGRVEREQMAPFFQARKVGPGVEATVELLVGEAMQNAAGEGTAGTELRHLSGGGGAKTPVAIGSGAPAKAPAAAPESFAPGETPLETLRTYLEVLRGRIKDPELPLYTPETRKFFRRWLVTDGQQAQELRTLSAALPGAEARITDSMAVVRFPPGERQSPPYLLRRGEGGWQLDFAAMSRLVGFNHLNQWYFRDLSHPWMFAFADWEFDGKGFPHRP